MAVPNFEVKIDLKTYMKSLVEDYIFDTMLQRDDGEEIEKQIEEMSQEQYDKMIDEIAEDVLSNDTLYEVFYNDVDWDLFHNYIKFNN